MKHATWIAAALSAPLAFGQAMTLDGLGLETGFGGVGLGANHTPINLQPPFALTLTPEWRLGVGLNVTQSPAAPAMGLEATASHRTAIDIMPSYTLSNALTVYGKLSTAPATAVSLTTVAGLENSLNLNGLGYGVGIHAQLDKNLFLQGALDLNQTSDFSTPKAGASVFSLGVGYRF
jgi:opacity protein-like surface antigen